MSYQPPQGPPQGLPQGQPQPSPQAQAEQRQNELIEQMLGGELPGAGYLYPDDPEKRQESLVTTTPEFVRDALLRGIETMAFGLMLPFGMATKADLAKAILATSQSYLLLDPSVDENGVEVGAGAAAQGEAQEAAARAQGEAQIAAQQHQHELTLAQNQQQHEHALELAAHQAALQPDPESFKRAPATGGHQEPPRVQPNAAEKGIEEENKPKTQVLKGARGDRPLPRPRVGQ